MDNLTEIQIKQLPDGKAHLYARIYGEVFEREYPDVTLAVIACEELLEFEGGEKGETR